VKNNTRETNIINSIDLKKLPFSVGAKDIFNFTQEVNLNLKKIFSFKKESLIWCFSSQKKMKIFYEIFDANENSKSTYKEEIAKKLPEYSYKTIATIIDEGITKGFFINLKSSDISKKNDKKILNIRPSEELVADFINWNIEVICIFNDYNNLKIKN
jgi:hypothetical protein|tara:strand:- start:206 stop:676 length:471 start_codon:yes stop_codon:yes gene_type:complete